MSLVLDALRKMELERKAKRQGSTAIRADVLNYRGSAPTPTRSWLFPVIISVAVIAAVTIGVISFTAGRKTTAPAVPPAAQVPPTVTELLPQQTVPAAVTQTVTPSQQPDNSAVEPPRRSRRAAAATPGKQVLSAAVLKNGDNGITLSGIAWQDERQLRRAVINGYLVEEGGEVQGAKIVEIRPNSVRFSKGNETFEIVHNAGMVK